MSAAIAYRETRDIPLVVYYPHLLVLPQYQRRGIGRALVEKLRDHYAGFHMQILVADGAAVEFYRSCGFEAAGGTQSMGVYRGDDHV